MHSPDVQYRGLGSLFNKVLVEIRSAKRGRFFKDEYLLGEGFVEDHFFVPNHQASLPFSIFYPYFAGIVDSVILLKV